MNEFVDLAADPSADIVDDGDLDDFEFSETVSIPDGRSESVLTDLYDTLPQAERYSYVFEGNTQTSATRCSDGPSTSTSST